MLNMLKKILTVTLIICMGVCAAAPAFAADAPVEKTVEQSIFTKISDAVDKYGETVVKAAADLLKKLGDNLPGWMKSIWDYLKGEIDLITKIVSDFSSGEKHVAAVINEKGSKVGDAIPKAIDNNGKLYWPIPYSGCYISAAYAGDSHKGIDICVTGGSDKKNIAAAQSATVLATGSNFSAGKYVILDHGNGLFSLCYHCSAVLVETGDTVQKGDVIAKTGQSGNATEPHLHFEVRIHDDKGVHTVDPLSKVSLP